MTEEPEGNHVQRPSAGEEAPQRVPQGMHLFDRRKPDRITVPYYVIEQYAPVIGPYATLTYLGLCFRVGRVKRVHPSYATVAKDLGISRSSVERSMRTLKQHGLVLVVPRIDGRGQHSNYIYLVDPGTTLADIEEQPPPPAAPPTPPKDPAIPAGRRPPVEPTARAPSIGRRALEVDPGSTTSEEGDAPPPEDLPSQTEEAKAVTDAWMRALLCSAQHLRREHKREITLAAIELLRRSYTVAHLIATVQDPDRDASEWPRHWRGRVLKQKPRANVDRATKVAQQRAAQARESEKAADGHRAARAFGGFAGVAKLKAQGLDVKGLLTGAAEEPQTKR